VEEQLRTLREDIAVGVSDILAELRTQARSQGAGGFAPPPPAVQVCPPARLEGGGGGRGGVGAGVGAAKREHGEKGVKRNVVKTFMLLTEMPAPLSGRVCPQQQIPGYEPVRTRCNPLTTESHYQVVSKPTSPASNTSTGTSDTGFWTQI
jgi:hypothetical protein